MLAALMVTDAAPALSRQPKGYLHRSQILRDLLAMQVAGDFSPDAVVQVVARGGIEPPIRSRLLVNCTSTGS
jgi:hypothetical protein